MAYQTALAAVCVEGVIFIILAVTGLRLRLIRLVPKSIMLATSAGRVPKPSVLTFMSCKAVFLCASRSCGSLCTSILRHLTRAEFFRNIGVLATAVSICTLLRLMLQDARLGTYPQSWLSARSAEPAHSTEQKAGCAFSPDGSSLPMPYYPLQHSRRLQDLSVHTRPDKQQHAFVLLIGNAGRQTWLGQPSWNAYKQPSDYTLCAGIGLFLAFIGLQSQEGLGIISYDAGTLVSLGACPARSQVRLLVAAFFLLQPVFAHACGKRHRVI